MTDERVKYWTQGWERGNFGDWLTALLLERALVAPVVEADRYRLLGSAIDDALLRQDLGECADPAQACVALWCCGKRDDRPLSDDVAASCLFFGVRGPLTRAGLGLPLDTPMGDPGLLLPLVLPAPQRHGAEGGAVLCVPHFNDPEDPERLRVTSGADEVLTPHVSSMADVDRFVSRIAGASFVLAGSLHAAITACAFGVPFGFWDTGFVDCPFKWRDFAASLGVELGFCRTVAEARSQYAAVARAMVVPPLVDILACCPFAVRADVMARAVLLAGRGPDRDAERSRVARIVAHNAARREARRAGEGNAAPASGRWQQTGAEIVRHAEALRAQGASMGFEFGSRDLRFSSGQAGHAFLVSGWTTPNEVGPWSTGRHSMLRLPHASRWWSAPCLQIGMIAFIPHVPPFQGERCLAVRGNDVELGVFTLRNQSPEDAVYQAITIRLPEVLRHRAGDLFLAFDNDPAVSARDLGIGADDRPIAIAPTYAKLLEA